MQLTGLSGHVYFFSLLFGTTMNFKKLLAAAAGTAAIVGTIGFAYAQTNTTNRNADGTMRDAATQQQPAGSTGTMGTGGTNASGGTMPNTPGTMSNSTGTMPNTAGTMSNSSGGMSNSTGTMSNDRGTMGTERVARADRN